MNDGPKRRARPELTVLDASAALTVIQGESGADVVEQALANGASISTVNVAEVHSKLREQRIDPEPALSRLKASGLQVSAFDEVDAALVGMLRVATRELGLSLADRACLALGLRLHRPVLATDRMLADADVGVEVVLIR